MFEDVIDSRVRHEASDRGVRTSVIVEVDVAARWLAWVSLLLALVLLIWGIPPIGLLGVPIWTLLVSLLLTRTAGTSVRTDAALPT